MTTHLFDSHQGLTTRPSWVEALARAGYATRGALYIMIGGLAALAAFGWGGETTDSKGALLELYSQPFGEVLLGLAAAGLAGYAVFLFFRAALDPEREATGTWGPLKRAWWGLVGVLHASLAVWAVSMLVGSASRSQSGDEQARGLTAELLSWRPLGPWLVAAIGVGVLIAAVYQLYRAWKARLDDSLDLSSLEAHSRRWVVRAGRAGIAARACVALVAGAFLVIAAVRSSPGEAKGFAASLAALRALPLGGWLFAAVALGLIGFGLYQLVEARYRRIAGQTP